MEEIILGVCEPMPPNIYHAVVDWLLIHQSSLKYLSVTRIGDNCEYCPFIEGSLFVIRIYKKSDPLTTKVVEPLITISYLQQGRVAVTIYLSYPFFLHNLDPEFENKRNLDTI